MTELEWRARYLCELRGLDPETYLDKHGFPFPVGAIIPFSIGRRWEVVAREIESARLLGKALDAGPPK